MRNLRLSVHSKEHLYLRHLLTQRRVALGLSQRALAERLSVVHSFIGKVETGDRRLDIFEFMSYCRALEWNTSEVFNKLVEEFNLPSHDLTETEIE